MKQIKQQLLTQKAGDTLRIAILRSVAIKFIEAKEKEMASVVMQDIRDIERQNEMLKKS